MAQIHSLEVPIKKSSDWLHQMMTKSYAEAFEKFDIKEEIEKYNCNTLKGFDLKQEMDWITSVVEKVNSPVVFTHNDYRSSNLLITEPNDELIVCDFDISNYGHRGSDFNNLYREWGPKREFIKPITNLPIDDSVLKPLLEIYVKESQRINGKSYTENPINSVEHLIKEIKVFFLFGCFVGVTHTLKNDENSDGFPMNRQLCMVIYCLK